jgi:hypothetical protein
MGVYEDVEVMLSVEEAGRYRGCCEPEDEPAGHGRIGEGHGSRLWFEAALDVFADCREARGASVATPASSVIQREEYRCHWLKEKAELEVSSAISTVRVLGLQAGEGAAFVEAEVAVARCCLCTKLRLHRGDKWSKLYVGLGAAFIGLAGHSTCWLAYLIVLIYVVSTEYGGTTYYIDTTDISAQRTPSQLLAAIKGRKVPHPKIGHSSHTHQRKMVTRRINPSANVSPTYMHITVYTHNTATFTAPPNSLIRPPTYCR